MKSGIIHIGGKRVCFQHIPKTGGQSVYRTFRTNLRDHLPADCRIRREELATCNYAFAFVRDPLERAVSTFYWFRQLHLKDGRRVPTNAIFNQWCRNTDVNSFWQKVDLDWVNQYSPMLRPQSYFVTRADGSLHPRIKIFKLEEIEKSWPIIMEDLGITAPLKHVNRSNHLESRAELTPSTIGRLKELYAEDFSHFYLDSSTDTKYS